MINVKLSEKKSPRANFGSVPLQMRLHEHLEANGYLARATSAEYIASLQAKAAKVPCFPDILKKSEHSPAASDKVIILGTTSHGVDLYGYEMVKNSNQQEASAKGMVGGRSRNQRSAIVRSKDALTKVFPENGSSNRLLA